MRPSSNQQKRTGKLHKDWVPEADPVLKEMLDHIAQELASEYLQLMKMVQQTPDE